MYSNLRIFLALFILFSLSACTENIVTECDNPDQHLDTNITFTYIQQEVFNKNCSFAGCHAGENPASGLDLSEGNAYNNLINIKSRQVDKMRVEPGNSQGSYLIDKLKGNGTSQMPPGGSINVTLIDSIAAWIDNGALNN